MAGGDKRSGGKSHSFVEGEGSEVKVEVKDAFQSSGLGTCVGQW